MKEALLAVALYFAALVCVAGAQPPPQYQVQWQPVYVPGRYYVCPRPTGIGQFLFGPVLVFIPDPPQQPYQQQR